MGTCEMICSQLALEHNEIVGPKRNKNRSLIKEKDNEVNISKNTQSINHSNHFLISPQQKHQNTYNNFEIFESDSNHTTTNNNNQAKNNITKPIPGKKYFTIRNYRNGDQYKGSVINEMLHGFGRYTSSSTLTTYEGEFVSNTMTGFGTEKWRKDIVYIGEYENNIKNGIGILSFENNVEFKGEIKNNKANGIGRIDFLKEGITIEGEFVNQSIANYGIYKDDSNNRVYEGEMLPNGEWNGTGLLLEKKAKIIYFGTWELSKLKGMFYTIENHKDRKEVRIFTVSGQTIEERYDKINQSMDKLLTQVHDEFKEYLI